MSGPHINSQFEHEWAHTDSTGMCAHVCFDVECIEQHRVHCYTGVLVKLVTVSGFSPMGSRKSMRKHNDVIILSSMLGPMPLSKNKEVM